jgi:hypothetical protein
MNKIKVKNGMEVGSKRKGNTYACPVRTFLTPASARNVETNTLLTSILVITDFVAFLAANSTCDAASFTATEARIK